MSGYLIVNPRSGDGAAGPLVEAARRLGVETRVLRPGDDPVRLAREARAEALGVAGGDGSLAAVAAVAAERDLPFVCVPFGTRNHFARDLGLDRDDPEAALPAFAGVVERRVDLAFAGDRPFLNNVSLGAYATLVHRREHHRRRRDAFARLRALTILATHRRERLVVDGEPVEAHVVLVASNGYRLEALSLGERDRLDEGELHLYRAEGLLPSSWEEREGPTFLVDAPRGRVHAAVDGEPAVLDAPVRFRIEPRALRVLLPPGMRSSETGTSVQTTREDEMENPKPTEREQELAGTERHRQEEAMRGGAQHEELPVERDAEDEGEEADGG